MANVEDLLAWIGSLSSANADERASAAANVFRQGVAGVASIIENLRADSEFRSLTDMHEANESRNTPESVRFVVGVAVEPRDFEKIRAANGSPPFAHVPPDQDAVEFELQFESHIELDILTTCDPEGSGAIARFLRKFGAGIQQIELYVRDVDRTTEILKTRFGIQPIYPATRPGANGTRVNFFLVPIAAGGKALLELVQDQV